MTPYVIYARKSTEAVDRQVASVESQINELQLLAARRNLKIVDVLSESGSAKRLGRPGFRQLMRRIHRGEIRGILCWKLDRLARNGAEGGEVLHVLEAKLVEAIVTIDRTFTPSGDDRLIAAIELGMSTKFSDDLSQNVQRGVRARLERGWVNHTPRLGYLIDPVTKEIIADPKRFEPIQRMLYLVLQGTMHPMLVLKIATEQWHLLTRKGKPLSRSTFYNMLADPFYAGVNELKDGRVYQGAHPQMVTMAEWQRLQEVLGRSGRQRPKRHSFAFTGILKCGHCGGGVTGEEHVKRTGRYVYYRCSRRRVGYTCHEPPIAERDLVAQIGHQIRFLAMPERIHGFLCREAMAEHGLERGREEHISRTLNQVLTGLEKEESNLVDLRARDLLADEVFLTKRNGVLQRRVAAREQMHRLSRQSADGPRLVSVFNFAARAQEVLRTGSAVQQRTIAERVGLNYTLRGRKVAFSLTKPFDRIAEAGALSAWSGLLDDVRKWLHETTEYFNIPDLDAVPPGEATVGASFLC